MTHDTSTRRTVNGMRRLPLLAVTAVLALATPLLSVDVADAAHARASDSPRAAAPAERRAPDLAVSTRVANLNHPWDVKELPGGSLLITERDPARLTLSRPSGRRQTVGFPTSKIWTSGETGLMGLAIDPAYKKNRRFYTCSGWRTDAGGQDIRVNAWKMAAGEKRATLIRPIVTGLPTTSGRHGGCRLLIAKDGSLVVGTGDAAVSGNPRNLRSLGGKTLRVGRFTGRAWPSNPFIDSPHYRTRIITTYGHRNVQGLAQRANGSLWSVEHGSYRDDEVNLLVGGGDYGWQPGPGYDESAPMTDQSLPGQQVNARWSSGEPTIATSGATFVYGKRWGTYDGALFVAALAGEELVVMKFGPKGYLQSTATPAALDGAYGRLRTVTQLRDGNVLVATDADGGQGRILLVRPR